jgi:uncharacterized protein YrrD
MALDLDIKRCWFHRNHYDIPKQRISEITAKCIIISSKDIIRKIKQANFLYLPAKECVL